MRIFWDQENVGDVQPEGEPSRTLAAGDVHRGVGGVSSTYRVWLGSRWSAGKRRTPEDFSKNQMRVYTQVLRNGFSAAAARADAEKSPV